MAAAAHVYEWLKLDREVSSQLRVRGWEKLERGSVAAKPVAHPDAVELTLIEEGTVRYDVGGEEILASAGQIVVVPREVEHATSFLTPMRGVALWLGGDLVAELADSMGPEVRGSLLAPGVLTAKSGRIARLLRILVDEIEEGDVGHARAAEALAESVVIEMLRRAPRDSAARPGLAGHAGSTSARDRRILAAIARMHASYSDPLSVDDLAKTAKMSRFHFSRLFRDEVGQAPYQYLLQVRLARAAELLRSGHCSVTEAALAAGFSDFSRFSRMFKKYTPADGGADVTTNDDASAGAPLAEMSTARSLFGAVPCKDGKVRAFGGLSTLGLEASDEAYDAVANAWTNGKAANKKRYAHATALGGDGKVYVFGGSQDGKTGIASVEIYSPDGDAWVDGPALPTPRLGLAAATGKDGRIFVIGGRSASAAASDAVEIFTPSSGTWSTGPSLPTPRLSLQAVTAADGRIYAIGGRDATDTALSVVEVLDPTAGTWSTEQPMAGERYWFGAALGGDGRIYAVGGINAMGAFTAKAEVLTPGTGWSALPNLPEPRAWNAAASAPDGRVLVLGGATTSGSVGQPSSQAIVYAFDAKSTAWK